jgi:CRISPR-associated protein Cas6
LLGQLVRLTGTTLELNGHPLAIGIPEVYPLTPYPTLVSRLVTIKNAVEEGTFTRAAVQQLSLLGVKGRIRILAPQSRTSFEAGRQDRPDRQRIVRRTLRISGKEIVGFPVEISGLSDPDSLRVLEQGLGGRRHFGCGLFAQTRGSRP